MHTKSLKKLALALTFWLALHASLVRAQTISAPPLTISSTGTDPVDFEFRADGTLIAKGNYGVGSLLSSDQGAGTRMLWFPSLGAFRAGGVNWNSANIGAYSAAFGADTVASGPESFAAGIGDNASGNLSTALGCYNTASGYYSLATGADTLAAGRGASAFGLLTAAVGDYSTTFGYQTTASAYGDFVVGVRNIGAPSSYSQSGYQQWNSSDPIFEVGNGGYWSWSGYWDQMVQVNYSDALEVFKSGDAVVQGNFSAGSSINTGGTISAHSTIRCAAGGDLSMGSFTAGTAP
jgi:hypothetical protein